MKRHVRRLLEKTRSLHRRVTDKDAWVRRGHRARLQLPGKPIHIEEAGELLAKLFPQSQFADLCCLTDIALANYFRRALVIYLEQYFPSRAFPRIPRWALRRYIKWATKLNAKLGGDVPAWQLSARDASLALATRPEATGAAGPQPTAPPKRTRREWVDPFAGPKAPEGWSYEWKMLSLYGVPEHEARLKANGWERVPLKVHPHILTSDPRKRDIIRKGMVLMRRPRHLTDEARREDFEIAAGQLHRAGAAELGRQFEEKFGGSTPPPKWALERKKPDMATRLMKAKLAKTKPKPKKRSKKHVRRKA